MVAAEQLTTVVIRFYRPGGSSEEHYYTVELDNAHIASITPAYASSDINLDSDHEVVTFVYENITWTWVLDGSEASDSWAQ